MARTCHYCGNPNGKQEAELRPYGPGGADVCYSCAFATPERKEQTKGAFYALLRASEAVSSVGVAAIGQDAGPVPFEPGDLL